MLSDFYRWIDTPEQYGKDIVVPETREKALYISEDGELFCYFSVFKGNKEEVSHRNWPNFLCGKGTRSSEKDIKGFFMIRDGCILLTEFIDHDYYSHKKYRQLTDYVVQMPTSNSCRFGIGKKIEASTAVYFEENEELSRACFGLTYWELEYLIKVYAQRLGIQQGNMQCPRITRSMTKHNFCDITGIWIPPRFPYIAFSSSGHPFSHISLYGFYRHLGTMLAMGPKTKSSRIFEHKTFCSKIIRQIRQIDGYFPYELKVTQELLKCS